jgi:ATP-dependent protease ClpP protease subunit
MKTALIIGSAVLALLLAPLGMKTIEKVAGPAISKITINPAAQEKVIPPSVVSFEDASEVKLQDIKKTITMEDSTMVELRGPVSDSSVGKAIKELQAISRKVSKTTELYLVLDTPGGDVVAGTDLIDFAKALPQKVNTITLFAASMGFQIAQNLDTRYITRSGTLMSHRARVGGVGGQVKGELEVRVNMIRRQIDMLDFVASQRMGMAQKDYEAMIFNEYWVYGFDAVGQKAADEQVNLRCGESLSGSEAQVFNTMFGPVKVTFSKCPLIKEPESIEMGNVAEEHRTEVLNALKMSLTEEKDFVQQYILTSKYQDIFR